VPRISIIIPALGSVDGLEDTLVGVLQHRSSASEVLLIQDGCYEDQYGLADEVHFVEMPAGSTAVAALNAGLALCRGEIVHILGRGFMVPPGWCEPALARFIDPAIAAAPLVVAAQDRRRIVTAGERYGAGGSVRTCGAGMPTAAAWRGKLVPDGPALLAAFYRRADLMELGGFDPSVGDELAAIDAALALSARGRRVVLEPGVQIPAALWHAASAGGAFLGGVRAERLFWRHAASRGWAGSLILHAIAVAGELLSTPLRPSLAARLYGRAAGFVSAGVPRKQAIKPTVAAEDSTAGRQESPRGDAVSSGTWRVDRPHAKSAGSAQDRNERTGRRTA
jgi:hypothetical protein